MVKVCGQLLLLLGQFGETRLDGVVLLLSLCQGDCGYPVGAFLRPCQRQCLLDPACHLTVKHPLELVQTRPVLLDELPQTHEFLLQVADGRVVHLVLLLVGRQELFHLHSETALIASFSKVVQQELFHLHSETALSSEDKKCVFRYNLLTLERNVEDEYDISVRQLRTLFTYWCHVCCLRYQWDNLVVDCRQMVSLISIHSRGSLSNVTFLLCQLDLRVSISVFFNDTEHPVARQWSPTPVGLSRFV